MRTFNSRGPDPRRRLVTSSRATGSRPTSLPVRDGASMRLVAAMAGPRLAGSGGHLPEGAEALARLTPFAGEAAESDARYFRRRAAQERRAADAASVPQARAAHRELAVRYAHLSRQTMPSRSFAPRHRASAARMRLADVLSQRFGLSGDVRQDRQRLATAHGFQHRERNGHETGI